MMKKKFILLLILIINNIIFSYTGQLELQYRKALGEFSKQNYRESINYFLNFIKNPLSKKNIDLLANSYLHLGKSYNNLREFKLAEYYLFQLFKNTPINNYFIEGLFEIAKTYNLQQKYKDSIEVYDYIVEKLAEKKYISEAIYLKGEMLLSLQKKDEAIKSFEDIVNNYKTSHRYADALEKLKLLKSNIIQQPQQTIINQERTQEQITQQQRQQSEVQTSQTQTSKPQTSPQQQTQNQAQQTQEEQAQQRDATSSQAERTYYPPEQSFSDILRSELLRSFSGLSEADLNKIESRLRLIDQKEKELYRIREELKAFHSLLLTKDRMLELKAMALNKLSEELKKREEVLIKLEILKKEIEKQKNKTK